MRTFRGANEEYAASVATDANTIYGPVRIRSTSGLVSGYGTTERERSKTWYGGVVGGRSVDSPPTNGMGTAVTVVEDRGYGELADRLRNL
jgi:hypothetical protein